MSGLDALDPKYRLILCDVWGVVHDGVSLYPRAAERLRQWRDEGRFVVLITNAPRTAEAVTHQLERPFEVRLADEMAEVVPPRLILRVKRQVIDELGTLPDDAKQRPDEGLDAVFLARLGEGHRAIQTVTVTDGDRREAPLLRQARDGFGVDGPFEHRIA